MDIITKLARSYHEEPKRLQAIDAFMVFLVAVGVVQFLFCLLVGNFPFNAFLGGFASAVGQFVLLAALRIQVERSNAKEFSNVGPKRAFHDFVFSSLLLHFIVYHFIN